MTLVVAAHGTASEAGRRVVETCAAAAAAELGVPHAVGYVDVCGPTLAEVLTSRRSSRVGGDGSPAPVVVPFFLASGYHVRHDVPSAVSLVAGASTAPALGAADEVVTALADRVREASSEGVDAVVLTAAGSSVDSARAEVAEAAARLGERLRVATGTAYLTGPGPRPEDEVGRLRAQGHARVVLAAHLLAPGHFHDRAQSSARRLRVPATPALGDHPALAALVVRRYRQGAAAAASPAGRDRAAS